MQVEFPELGQSCKLTPLQLGQLVRLKVKSPQLKRVCCQKNIPVGRQ